jgi:hypothetical protein
MTNAAIEFAEPDHPAAGACRARTGASGCWRWPAVAGARDPAMLADALALLFEGAYASSQTFGPDRPARSMAQTAAALLDAQRHAPTAWAAR